MAKAILAQAGCVPTHAFSKTLAMAAPATPADVWTVVEEFAAARELREIDGAAILAPVACMPSWRRCNRRWPASAWEMMTTGAPGD